MPHVPSCGTLGTKWCHRQALCWSWLGPCLMDAVPHVSPTVRASPASVEQHPQDSFLFLLSADAEMVLNSENKPLPLKNFAAPHLPHSEGTKPLPPGARRWVWAQLHQALWEGQGFAVPVAGCRQQGTVPWGCQRAKVTVPSCVHWSGQKRG